MLYVTHEIFFFSNKNPLYTIRLEQRGKNAAFPAMVNMFVPVVPASMPYMCGKNRLEIS